MIFLISEGESNWFLELIKDPNFIVSFVFVLVFPGLWKLAMWTYNRRRVNKASRDLHPYFTQEEVKEALSVFVETKGQNAPPDDLVIKSTVEKFAAKTKLVPFFIKKGFKNDSDDQRFYMVMADSGMGKTTFLINLYVRYKSSVLHNQFKIKLLPLANPDIWNQIEKMSDHEKANTILLLDAFDEDPKAIQNSNERLSFIIDRVKNFREILITCRVQFFSSEQSEPIETLVPKYGGEKGYHEFQRIYLSPFDKRDVKKYLNKRYGLIKVWNFRKKRMAIRMTNRVSNLIVRPMLLHYADSILRSKNKLGYVFEIYEELISGWIGREDKSTKIEDREKFQKTLYEFSRAMALKVYHNIKLSGVAAVEREQVAGYADLGVSDLKIWEMTGRSLLSRDSNGMLKFSHRSILEYFLAKEYFEDELFANKFDFSGMSFSKKVYLEMVWEKNFIKPIKENLIKGTYKSFTRKATLSLKSISLVDLRNVQALHLEKFDQLNIDLLEMFPKLQILSFGSIGLNKYQINCLRSDKAIVFNLQNKDSMGRKKSFSVYEVVQIVAKLHRIRSLSFSNTNLANIEPLKELSTIKTLKHLNVRGNQISSLNPLSNFSRVEKLNLCQNSIDDLAALRSMKNLKHLLLYGNHLEQGQVDELKSFLPECKIEY